MPRPMPGARDCQALRVVFQETQLFRVRSRGNSGSPANPGGQCPTAESFYFFFPLLFFLKTTITRATLTRFQFPLRLVASEHGIALGIVISPSLSNHPGRGLCLLNESRDAPGHNANGRNRTGMVWGVSGVEKARWILRRGS